MSQLEIEGRLGTATREAGGVYYEESAVTELLKTYAPGPRALKNRAAPKPKAETRVRGEIAAKVFACFDRGMGLVEVTKETLVDPDTVDRLWTRYNTPAGEIERQAQAKDEARRMHEETREKARFEFLRQRERIKLIETNKLDRATVRRLAKGL